MGMHQTVAKFYLLRPTIVDYLPTSKYDFTESITLSFDS